MLELLEQLKQRLGRRGAVRVGEHNIVATRGMKATQDGTAFTDPLADFQHRDLVALARRFCGYARGVVFTAVGDNDDLEALTVAATKRRSYSSSVCGSRRSSLCAGMINVN